MLIKNIHGTVLLMFIISITAQAQISHSYLTVEGEVSRNLQLTIENMKAFKQEEVSVSDRDEKMHRYTGVKLVHILDSAGVTLGSQLRGKNLVKYVLVKAIDGYEVLFSLPEIDPEFTNQFVLLAYLADGIPLPKGEGPFRVIVPNDKKHARWIREVSTIKILFTKE